MYQEDDYLLLSGIQHFSFCRRQWALIHIENQWAENGLTAEGRVQHTRVHDQAETELRGDVLTVRGMRIKSAELGATGECDAVIFTRAENGVKLHGRKGTWTAMPVEYKHGKQKVNDCDRMQAAAQAICLEEMLCCRIEQAAVYHFETRTREYVPITEELRSQVRSAFAEMHDYMRRGYTPKVRPSASCTRCSLRELCLPSILKKKEDVGAYIRAHLQEAEE